MKRELATLMVVAFMLGAVPALLRAQQEKRGQPGTKLSDEQLQQWVAQRGRPYTAYKIVQQRLRSLLKKSPSSIGTSGTTTRI